jgi:hypothetical protein
MGPFYELICAENNKEIDQALLSEMQEKNEKKLKAMDIEIADVEQNLGKFLRFFCLIPRFDITS